MRSVRSSPNNGFLEQCPHPPRRFVVPKIAQQESLERNTSRAFRLEVSETYSTGRLLGNAEAQCRQGIRSEEHTSELQSLMRISYAVFCLKKKQTNTTTKKKKTSQLHKLN